MRPQDRHEALHVVFVCTGNRFRSPLAEAIFRRAAPPGVRTDSFGTLDIGPIPPLEGALVAAERLSLDLSSHLARPLSQGDLARADLVIGFERSHVLAAVVDARARRERTFTLPELVLALEKIRLVPRADPVAHARRALELLDARRRPVEPKRTRSELRDPLGQPEDVQREVARRLEELTGRLAQQLFGGGH